MGLTSDILRSFNHSLIVLDSLRLFKVFSSLVYIFNYWI